MYYNIYNIYMYIIYYKGDIRSCTTQNTISQGIFSWNLKSLGNFNRELELSGRIFIWNLIMLLRGSILCRTLPDVTFIIHVYTKFSPSFRFGEHDLARCLQCSNSHPPARCWSWRAKSICWTEDRRQRPLIFINTIASSSGRLP